MPASVSASAPAPVAPPVPEPACVLDTIVVAIPTMLKPTGVWPGKPIIDMLQWNEEDSPGSDDEGSSSSDNNEEHKKAWQEEFAAAQAQHAASHPGHIPEGLGMVIVNDKYEQDNELWMMLSHYMFYSVKSNCVYAGKTAAMANDYESHLDAPYMTEDGRCMYSYLPQGFLMNLHEVLQGVRFINDPKELAINHVEAYQLLAEFHHVSGGFVPELWDLAMQVILKDEVYTHKVRQPHPNNYQLWENFPVCRDKDVFTGNIQNCTQGTRLVPYTSKQLLDINIVAQYTMHHRRLGSSNAIHGIAMNVPLQEHIWICPGSCPVPLPSSSSF